MTCRALRHVRVPSADAHRCSDAHTPPPRVPMTPWRVHRSGDKTAAAQYFFHSFTGAVVYAHGTPLNISGVIRPVVNILSDGLFMVVVVHLLRMLACRYVDGIPELIAAPEFTCWSGRHAMLGTIALVAYSLYAPLSIMLGVSLSSQCKFLFAALT